MEGVISLADRSTGDGLLITLESQETMDASAEQAWGLRAESEGTGGGREAVVRGYAYTVPPTLPFLGSPSSAPT